jgi:DNA-binding transcriptional LysR family regulator
LNACKFQPWRFFQTWIHLKERPVLRNILEIRYLTAVVILAEELNYTRAATRLRMSQSGLSRRIQDVELKLDTMLFQRDRSSVELTDAGRAFVEEARLSILHDERAVRVAK